MSITERRPHLLHADQGKVVRARADLYLFKALAAQTEGHYSLFEARSITGGGVPLHRHQHDEEGVFVLEGRYRFQLGNEQIELGPGDFLHVPRPTPHAFEALEPSRMLVIVAPGGFHERISRKAGRSSTTFIIRRRRASPTLRDFGPPCRRPASRWSFQTPRTSGRPRRPPLSADALRRQETQAHDDVQFGGLRAGQRRWPARLVSWVADDRIGRSDQTRGGFTLIEQVSPPNVAAPAHVHASEEEAFYVHDGQLEVTCGDQTWSVEQGGFVLLPRGIPQRLLGGRQPWCETAADHHACRVRRLCD